MTVPLHLPSGFICALLPLEELGTVLKDGLRSVDSGGLPPLGSPDFMARRAAFPLPPPFRGPVDAYVGMRFTPLTASSLSVLTGYRGAEQIPPEKLVFIVSEAGWVRKLHRKFLFTNIGLISGKAEFFTDLEQLDVIDRGRLALPDFDTSKDPSAPHIAEAEFLVWEALPPRAIVEVVCSDKRVIHEVEEKIVAAGRSGTIKARADRLFFFGRT